MTFHETEQMAALSANIKAAYEQLAQERATVAALQQRLAEAEAKLPLGAR